MTRTCNCFADENTPGYEGHLPSCSLHWPSGQTHSAPAPDAPAARRVTAQPLSAQDMPEVDCCPMCASVGIDKVQERTKGRWGDRPEVEFDDEVWRCVDCGEEWYDPHMANRHTLQLLKATLAAAEARAVRAEGALRAIGKLTDMPGEHPPEKIVEQVTGLRENFNRICERLQDAVQRHHLGLGGEHIDELVVEALDEDAAIFRWLLGEEGEFPESAPGKRYAFRSELRQRLGDRA